ncbi:MAG: hypothetical protein ACE5I2_14080, partial [Anaerolineae bacterium]
DPPPICGISKLSVLEGRDAMKAWIFVALLLIVIACGPVTQATGPTGEKLPPHIDYTNPADGSTVSEVQAVCARFLFQEGNGLGERAPEERITFYLDDKNVTDKVDGLLSLDVPRSYGLLCYKSERPLPSGWRTARVVYRDIKGTRFEYSWRFKVQ